MQIESKLSNNLFSIEHIPQIFVNCNSGSDSAGITGQFENNASIINSVIIPGFKNY